MKAIKRGLSVLLSLTIALSMLGGTMTAGAVETTAEQNLETPLLPEQETTDFTETPDVSETTDVTETPDVSETTDVPEETTAETDEDEAAAAEQDANFIYGTGTFKGDSEKAITQYIGSGGKVTIPADVYVIGEGAFKNCTNVTEVFFEGEWASIDQEAFYGCTNMKKIHFPAKTIKIGYAAFQNCSSLEGFNIDYWRDGIIIDGCSFQNCTSLRYVNINTPGIIIGNTAFKGCTALKTVAIFSGAGTTDVYMGSGIFQNCTSLEEIDMTGWGKIPVGTFSGCTKLKYVNLYTTNVQSEAFYGCSALTGIYFPMNDSVDEASLRSTANINSSCTIYTGKGAKILDNIYVSQMDGYRIGVKLSCICGSDIDTSGKQLVLSYGDGTTANVDITQAMLTGYDINTIGTQYPDIEYNNIRVFRVYDSDYGIAPMSKGSGDNVCVLTVSAPLYTAALVTIPPAKSEYKTGETLDLTGGVITVTLGNNGGDLQLALTDPRVKVTGFNSQTTGKQTLTVTVDDSISASFNVNVVSSSAAVPPTVTATAADQSVKLSWTAVTDATKYAVSLYNSGSYEELNYNVTKTSYTVKNLTNGTTYKFLVQAYVNGKWSSSSTKYLVSATPKAPSAATPPTVTATAADQSVKLSWTAVTGATKYAVSLYNSGSYEEVNYYITKTSYTVKNLTNGTTYKFLVQAYVDGKWSSSSTKYLVSATPKAPSAATPPTVTATAGDQSVKLSWTAVTDATKYAVSLYNSGSYEEINYDVTKTSYTVKNLTNGTTYKFLVQAYVDGKWSSSSTKYLVSATPKAPSAATPPTVTATAGDRSVKLSWTAVTDAAKYAVSLYNSGSYEEVNYYITKTSYTVKNLTNGTTYKFLVQAYVDGKWSSSSTKYLVSATPKAPVTPPAVTAIAGDKSVTLTWKAVTGAAKYYVSKVNSDGSFTAVNSALTTNSITISGLTNGTTYRFLVQAYVDGAWTSDSSAYFVSATPVQPAGPLNTGVQKTITATGRYNNWDGVTNVAQFKGTNGSLWFAVDNGSTVTIYKTSKGALLTGTVTLTKPHSLFGTVICDSDGNFYLVTGETNQTDDTSVETVFISKFNSSGTLIKTVGDNGSSSTSSYWGTSYYTKIPFDGGCCDAAIYGNVLAVNYAREMYSGHQSNSILTVNIDDMTKISLGSHYNSHSFAQRAISTSTGFTFMSEGDCYDRAFTVFSVKMSGTSRTSSKTANIFDFWVKDGALDEYNMYVVNENFAHMGGIAPLSDGRIAFAAQSAQSLNSNASTESEEVFIQIFDPFGNLTSADAYTTTGTRSGLAGENGRTQVTNYGVKWLTNYGSTSSIKNVQIASTDKDKIIVLYELYTNGSYKGVYYIVLNADGTISSEAKCFSETAYLNPCEMPVFADGRVCWTGNKYGDSSHNIYLYMLDPAGTASSAAAFTASGVRVITSENSISSENQIVNQSSSQFVTIDLCDQSRIVRTDAKGNTIYPELQVNEDVIPELKVTGTKLNSSTNTEETVTKVFKLKKKDNGWGIIVLDRITPVYANGEFASFYFDKITDIQLTFSGEFSTTDSYTYEYGIQPAIDGSKRWYIGDTKIWNFNNSTNKYDLLVNTFGNNYSGNLKTLNSESENTAAAIIAFALTHGGYDTSLAKYVDPVCEY